MGARKRSSSAHGSRHLSWTLTLGVPPLPLLLFSPRSAAPPSAARRLSKEHPDPDGRQLKEVLAPAIEWYMSERAKYISGKVCAVTWAKKDSAAKEEVKLAAPFRIAKIA